ncbi:GNAT family N-acetyltransferase [Streptomyces sp. 6N223]|uniref:GNAT family N-acetyltransferase n=1 Tax=Streptomyces sp. 6N223 TaxID=3457412 RepID=UPI003FD0122B
MGMVFLRRLSRWQAETERADIADLYAAEATRETAQEFTRRFVDHDVQQPGFDMVVAADPALAGYAYGFRADRGGPWWQGFTDVPAEVRELTASRQIFAVAGLLVAPRRRREQVASRMLRELLTRSDASLAIAVLEPGDAAALAAFHSWGWSKAGQLAPAGGSPPLEAWARRL